MNFLTEIQALLPSPYSVAGDAVMSQFLGTIAIELEAIQEDIDRMRQTHWVDLAYRLVDLEKLAALTGTARLPWEELTEFRARLESLVTARLAGALGPLEIQRFVVDYLSRAEQVLDAVYVPGLNAFKDESAFQPDPKQPLYRPLELVENPERQRRSAHLLALGGRVPYLHRWQETDKGLTDAVPTFYITGYSGKRTAVPILANLTTGQLIGYKGIVPLGRTLTLTPAKNANDPRLATASIDGRDVTSKIFSVSNFQMGTPFSPQDLDAQPRLPLLRRGDNDWIYLSVGIYDVPGLNSFFFAMADAQLTEGFFDRSRFDHALFPNGPVAHLEMEWIESEPASFEVHVPRYLTIEPAGSASTQPPLYQDVASALQSGIGDLHAAGVRAVAVFDPFVEEQRQTVRASLPWVYIDPETGPSGAGEIVNLGARYGESGLGETRFE